MRKATITVEAEPTPQVIVDALRVIKAYPHKMRKKAEKTGCAQCHADTDDTWDWFWGLNKHRSDLNNFDHELITALAMDEEITTKTKVRYFNDKEESQSGKNTDDGNLDDCLGGELQPA